MELALVVVVVLVLAGFVHTYLNGERYASRTRAAGPRRGEDLRARQARAPEQGDV